LHGVPPIFGAAIVVVVAATVVAVVVLVGADAVVKFKVPSDWMPPKATSSATL